MFVAGNPGGVGRAPPGNGVPSADGRVAALPSHSDVLRDLGFTDSQDERQDVLPHYVGNCEPGPELDLSAEASNEEENADKVIKVLDEVPANDVPPAVGMVFDSLQKAFEYYVLYASTAGFSVRNNHPEKNPRTADKSARCSLRSKDFVCSKQGELRVGIKRQRPERTGCCAHITVTPTSDGKCSVSEVVLEHNHQLLAPFDSEMLKSLKLPTNGSLIPPGCKNYLRAPDLKGMEGKDLKTLLEFFQRKKGDNPSFHYAIQVDKNDRAVNIFWSDAKSIMDFHYFGDVLCIDTANAADDSGRPLALFLGVNHHNQIIIFGAALIYGQTAESFKWLFESFKSAMGGKQPRTILTDQNAAIKEGVAVAFPGSIHRFSVWQLYQKAVKLSCLVSDASKQFESDFKACVFDIEDEQEFVASWESILDKYSLKDHGWLQAIYDDRESWALPWVLQIFTAGIDSALQDENLNALVSEYLNAEKDFSQFLELYDNVLDQKWQLEINAEYQSNHSNHRIPVLPLLWQAVNLYTPSIFDLFRKEFDFFVETVAYNYGESNTISEFVISVKSNSKEHVVRYNSSENSAQCSCRKFERIGIQCCHVLKVYDLKGFKEIPRQYFLKRWRKNAKCEAGGDENGELFENVTTQQRHGALCRNFYNIALKAAENLETFTLMVNQSDHLLDQVERILQARLIGNSNGTSSRDMLSNAMQASNDGIESQQTKRKKRNNPKTRNTGDTRQRQKFERDVTPTSLVTARNEALPLTQDGIHSQPSDQLFAPGRLVQSSLVEAPFGTVHNLGSNLTQFAQDTSVPSMQQQQYPVNGDQGYHPGPDINSIHFVTTNAAAASGQSTAVPVWDFL